MSKEKFHVDQIIYPMSRKFRVLSVQETSEDPYRAIIEIEEERVEYEAPSSLSCRSQTPGKIIPGAPRD
ncbi:MAG: hypothetical protein KF861_11075 [Planctomycetaceae bacterium]|nr:hypothetical protein [Planctomycetaceae bacterium]